jgi:O-methyltransferase involved in polyketide biosynthesis
MSDPHTAVDFTVPNAARMYDYFLGGKDNYAADRAAAERVLAVAPEMREVARRGRDLIGRVVHHLVEAGIRQIIDLGSGLPTQRNVHQIATAIDPDVHVVYVDHDPVVANHGKALLTQADRVAMIHADLLSPHDVLTDPDLTDLIDLDRPVAVLMMFVLHLLPDAAAPQAAVAAYRAAMAPGSYLAVSHASTDHHSTLMSNIATIYRDADSPFNPRTRQDVQAFFGDFALVEPGLVHMWPFHTPPLGVDSQIATMGWSGIGRKRP